MQVDTLRCDVAAQQLPFWTLCADAHAAHVICFTGNGRVTFGADTIRTYPEWWGVRGDGSTDDSAAVQVGLLSRDEVAMGNRLLASLAAARSLQAATAACKFQTLGKLSIILLHCLHAARALFQLCTKRCCGRWINLLC